MNRTTSSAQEANRRAHTVDFAGLAVTTERGRRLLLALLDEMRTNPRATRHDVAQLDGLSGEIRSQERIAAGRV